MLTPGAVAVALGGRVAEELVYGDVTTGAEEDIRQVTELARNMVARWGMSEVIGPVSVTSEQSAAPAWLAGEISQQTLELVDHEVRRLVDDVHAEVTRLLETHRTQLDQLARA